VVTICTTVSSAPEFRLTQLNGGIAAGSRTILPASWN